MEVERYSPKNLKITNDLLRDFIEPLFTLWTFYFTFILYCVELGIVISWPPDNQLGFLLIFIVKWLLFIIYYYVHLYTLNAEGASIKCYRAGKRWLKTNAHDFHAFIWSVFTC